MILNNTLKFSRFRDEHITTLITMTCLAFFMTAKGWANICFVLILLIAISQIKTCFQSFQRHRHQTNLLIMLAVLNLPIFALLITQSIRHDWVVKSYDAPIRILFGSILLFYFASRKVKLTDIIGLVSPICLVITAIFIYSHPEYPAKWSGRYATHFVDPNSFGAYAVIFTTFCLVSLINPLKKQTLWIVYQLIGIIVGIDLIIGSGTRGSWLSIPFVVLFWIFTNRKYITPKTMGLGLLVLSTFPILALIFFPNTANRLYGIYNEIYAWSHHAQVETSAGIRLTMWKMTWVLFQHNPLIGYGDIGVRAYLSEPWLTAVASPEGLQTIACCGPHNELLANIIRSGLLGGIAVMGLLAYPIYFVVRFLNHHDPVIMLASQLLIAYLLIEVICSISMEVFTLKYTASFYSLIVSGLIGQILFQSQQKSING